MKKIVCITILLVCLVSCISDETVRQWKKEGQIRREHEVSRKARATADEMYNVEFDGHKYVVLKTHVYYGRSVTMVHSPNCNCVGTIK